MQICLVDVLPILNSRQNQLKHEQFPPQNDYFAILQSNTLKPVHYLIKYEEVLPHQ